MINFFARKFDILAYVSVNRNQMDEGDKIKLTPGGFKKLGNLVNLKNSLISDAIRERGGGQSQVYQLRSDYQTLTVCEKRQSGSRRRRRC